MAAPCDLCVNVPVRGNEPQTIRVNFLQRPLTYPPSGAIVQPVGGDGADTRMIIEFA